MEQQIVSFAGTTAGSILIAVGLGVYAFPYAMKYLVKNAEEQAIPWAYAFGKGFYDEYVDTVKAALKKLEADEWHEANPDVTQADIDVPAQSGDPYTDYLEKVGLPLSTVLVAFGDKEALSVYQHSGEWNYYGTRQINGQHYYCVVPKGIKVYFKTTKTLTEAPDEHDLCRAGWRKERYNGFVVCEKEIVESFVLDPGAWP